LLCLRLHSPLLHPLPLPPLPTRQPDVLLNYSSEGLGELLPRGAALGLAVAVKLCFLINGLLSLPMYLYPYQVWGRNSGGEGRGAAWGGDGVGVSGWCVVCVCV
jgi:hypothetical protein